jgi:hypothetical protein
LGQVFCAAVKTKPHPTRYWLPNGQQKLEQRAQFHRQRVEDHVFADQDLFRGIPVFKEDWRNAI